MAVLVFWGGVGRAGTPATQSITHGSASLESREYCTVLLAPKLQDHLGVTDDQRLQLNDIKEKFRAYMHNAAGNINGPRISAGLIGGRGETVLGMIGPKVRDVLTPRQRDWLAAMLDDGTLKSINVTGELRTGRIAGGSSLTSEIRLDYTHFGESTPATKTTAATSQPMAEKPRFATVASTQPTEVANAPPRHSTPSPGRLRRMPHVDVATEIEALGADSAARQMSGANQLARATPSDAERPAVLAALRPFIKDSDDEHWASFVNAFCRWADVPEAELVQSFLATSDGLKAFDQKELSSSAACTALLRLKPDAAINAINTRVDNQLFRTHLLGDVHQLAADGDSVKPVAESIVDQLMHYQAGKPITLDK